MTLWSVDTERVVHAKALVARLTSGEREVVHLVVGGQMNRTIAKKLGVANRTVEARRSKAMKKLSVKSLPELVKAWILAEEIEL